MTEQNHGYQKLEGLAEAGKLINRYKSTVP